MIVKSYLQNKNRCCTDTLPIHSTSGVTACMRAADPSLEQQEPSYWKRLHDFSILPPWRLCKSKCHMCMILVQLSNFMHTYVEMNMRKFVHASHTRVCNYALYICIYVRTYAHMHVWMYWRVYVHAQVRRTFSSTCPAHVRMYVRFKYAQMHLRRYARVTRTLEVVKFSMIDFVWGTTSNGGNGWRTVFLLEYLLSHFFPIHDGIRCRIFSKLYSNLILVAMVSCLLHFWQLLADRILYHDERAHSKSIAK